MGDQVWIDRQVIRNRGQHGPAAGLVRQARHTLRIFAGVGYQNATIARHERAQRSLDREMTAAREQECHMLARLPAGFQQHAVTHAHDQVAVCQVPRRVVQRCRGTDARIGHDGAGDKQKHKMTRNRRFG